MTDQATILRSVWKHLAWRLMWAVNAAPATASMMGSSDLPIPAACRAAGLAHFAGFAAGREDACHASANR